ncbi:MAG: hypothetical protein ABIA47_00425 [bacterium]
MPTDTLEQLSEINTDIFTADLLIVLGVLALVIVYAYTLGKDYNMTMIYALYMAIAAMMITSFWIDAAPAIGPEPYYGEIGMFVVLFLIIFGVVAKNGFSEPSVVPSSWESAIFATVFTGLFLTAVFMFLPADVIGSLSPVVRGVLASDLALILWPLAPVALLLGTRGRA